MGCDSILLCHLFGDRICHDDSYRIICSRNIHGTDKESHAKLATLLSAENFMNPVKKCIKTTVFTNQGTHRCDMYPFYWTSSERGIFMRYTYEFKKKAVELYRQGKWIDAPNDIINLKNFHDMIVRWHHLEESNTSDCLKHYGTNKKWSPEEKYELVARVIAGDTITSVAYTVGINSGLLAQWIRKYKIWGYNGLVGRRKGRKPKESAMKKMNINNPRKLNESEYEELIRLRAEITYIKAENEAIKKEIALREEREAALLKAKKQQSSKNSKKKDIC